METLNITKGDWKIQEASQINHVVYSLLDGNRIDICCTYAGTVGKDQSEQNAKAIASLPALIKENEELKSDWVKLLNDGVEAKKENESLKKVNAELKELESRFYMAICRAYNAGKDNMSKCIQGYADNATDEGAFKSSHDYFLSEFPSFKTNIP